MNSTRDIDDTATGDEGGGLDPREAAKPPEADQTAGRAPVRVQVAVALAARAIVYGIYPPTAQLIVLGALGAAIAAAREDWPGFGVAIAIMPPGARSRDGGGVVERRRGLLGRGPRVQRRPGLDVRASPSGA